MNRLTYIKLRRNPYYLLYKIYKHAGGVPLGKQVFIRLIDRYLTRYGLKASDLLREFDNKFKITLVWKDGELIRVI